MKTENKGAGGHTFRTQGLATKRLQGVGGRKEEYWHSFLFRLSTMVFYLCHNERDAENNSCCAAFSAATSGWKWGRDPRAGGWEEVEGRRMISPRIAAACVCIIIPGDWPRAKPEPGYRLSLPECWLVLRFLVRCCQRWAALHGGHAADVSCDEAPEKGGWKFSCVEALLILTRFKIRSLKKQFNKWFNLSFFNCN